MPGKMITGGRRPAGGAREDAEGGAVVDCAPGLVEGGTVVDCDPGLVEGPKSVSGTKDSKPAGNTKTF